MQSKAEGPLGGSHDKKRENQVVCFSTRDQGFKFPLNQSSFGASVATENTGFFIRFNF